MKNPPVGGRGEEFRMKNDEGNVKPACRQAGVECKM